MNVALLILMSAILDWSGLQRGPEKFDKQEAFIEDCANPDKQYVFSFCGLQSGKTVGECDGAIAALYLAEKPLTLPPAMIGKTPMEVWLASKSYKLAETLFETFRWRAPEGLFMSDREIRSAGLTKGDRFTHWLRPRSAENCPDPMPIKLRVRTQSDPESLRAANTVGCIVEDEVAWWKEKSYLNSLGRGIVTKTKYIGGTTPHGKNFAFRMIAIPGGYAGGEKDPRYAVHAWTSADNPYADKAHIERLRKIFGRDYAKQELEGLFTDAIGYVFPTFDRTKHMGKIPSHEPKDYVEIVGGIDPGWTDAYAGTVMGKTEDGTWWQLWELHETQKTSDDLAPEFLAAQEKWKVERWYTDKRRPSDIKRLRDNGVRAFQNIDVYGETDRSTIKPMLTVLQGLMERDKLKICEDHEQTAEEFEKYHYATDDEKEKNTNDLPVDWMNHHCITGDSWVDCLDGRHQIRDLVGKENVYVWAFDGEIPKAAKASNIRLTRKDAPVVKVTFDNTTLTLTSDHLIMLKSGQWIEAGKLKYGDRVRALYKSVTENYVTLRTGRGKSKYEHAHRLAWASVNGPIPTGYHVHHKDENKLNNHPDNLELLHWKVHVAHHHPNLVKKAAEANRGVPSEHRTVPRDSICGYCGNHFLDTNIKARARKTCSKKCWAGLRIHNHKVISVEPHGFSDVFDMEVDTYHNFVANGVCVHNCDAIRYAVCAVEDLTHASPRYRKGSSQKPQEIKPSGPRIVIPTFHESMAYQDEKIDAMEEKLLGAGRKNAAHFLRQRAKVRGRLL